MTEREELEEAKKLLMATYMILEVLLAKIDSPGLEALKKKIGDFLL